ncbi:MAG TPA: transglutaminase domain-containing protein [Thermoanaerobaculia bacterium]|nr:transglutaminase domain-containing protein [Thermoanaerobaculia bacterium]
MTIQRVIRLRRRGVLLAAACLLAVLPLAAQTQAPPQTSDTWYVLTMGGQAVGSLHEQVTAGADAANTVQVSSKAHIALNRMGSKVEMEMGEVSREAPDGRLLGLDTELKASSQTMATKVTIENGQARVRETAGDRSFEHLVPFTGELLGEEGIRRLSAARLAKPGDSIEVQTWAAELGGVRKVTRTVVGDEAVTVDGAPIHTVHVEEVTEGNPAKRQLWLDSDGHLVQSSDPGPFGEMRSLRATEAAARRTDAGGELPAEAYAGTLIHTPVRIPHPRRVERLVLRLRHREPSLGWPAFDGPEQKVADKTAEALTLEITRPKPESGQSFPVAVTDDNRAYLEPSAYVQSDDPEIRAAAQSVVEGEKDMYLAGQKLQRWVTRNMNFDLGIVFAPSTEIFKSRRGTCAGYAMLLTAMARSVGIPARYVLGYVYLDGMFGGHAWVEIKVGKEWIPLDAAVPSDAPADATHLALLRTSLVDGLSGLGAGPALQMFGHLDIDVLSVTVAGKPAWTVPSGARLYTLTGDQYRNTGLGLEVTKPAGFRFSGLDDVWPESHLVVMQGPNGETVTLSRGTVYPGETAETVVWKDLNAEVPGGRHGTVKAAGRSAWSTAGDGKAALAWGDGEDLWILSAAGKDAPALLRRTAETVKLPN